MNHEEPLEHFGIKGMHWGVRKQQAQEQVRGTVRSKAQGAVRRASREYETGLVLAGTVAIGAAYIRSPTARKIMTVPVSATAHYMANADNRRKVAKALKMSYVVYSKI